MVYQTFAEFNNTGLSGFFLYPSQVVPEFIPLLLLATFLIGLMGSYFSSRRLTGQGDFFASFATASFITSLVAFSMTLIDNLINIEALLTVFAITIISVILLLTNKNR